MVTSVIIRVSPNGVPTAVGCETSAIARGASGRIGAPEIIPKMIALTKIMTNQYTRDISNSFLWCDLKLDLANTSCKTSKV